jgi:hypothetical protein
MPKIRQKLLPIIGIFMVFFKKGGQITFLLFNYIISGLPAPNKGADCIADAMGELASLAGTGATGHIATTPSRNWN